MLGEQLNKHLLQHQRVTAGGRGQLNDNDIKTTDVHVYKETKELLGPLGGSRTNRVGLGLLGTTCNFL